MVGMRKTLFRNSCIYFEHVYPKGLSDIEIDNAISNTQEAKKCFGKYPIAFDYLNNKYNISWYIFFLAYTNRLVPVREI